MIWLISLFIFALSMQFFTKILLFSAIVSLTSCVGEFKEISVNSINNFKVTKMDLKSVEGEINVSINNPNNKSFKVYRSKATVFVGGSKLGTACIIKKVKIPANSSVDNTFSLRGDFKELNFTTLTNITLGKPLVEIKGYLKAGKWFYRRKFPIEQKQKISGQDFKGLLPGF
ncbi:MAG TPA: LEA type 2 family protein [Bacteroidia bacterium]|nr:LEA type 2 family protein [Bacteroidia bacterium]